MTHRVIMPFAPVCGARVLVPGMWDRQETMCLWAMHLVGRGFIVVIVDLPGRQDSDTKLERVYTGDYVRAIIEAVELASRLNVGRGPLVLIGKSGGGPWSAKAAEVCGHLLDGLVLATPGPIKGVRMLSPSIIRRLISPCYARAVIYGRRFQVKSRDYLELLLNATSNPCKYLARRIDESGFVFRDLAFSRISVKLPGRFPVLVVGAELDRITPAKYARKITTLLGPRARYLELEGKDHMITVGSVAISSIRAIEAGMTEIL